MKYQPILIAIAVTRCMNADVSAQSALDLLKKADADKNGKLSTDEAAAYDAGVAAANAEKVRKSLKSWVPTPHAREAGLPIADHTQMDTKEPKDGKAFQVFDRYFDIRKSFFTPKEAGLPATGAWSHPKGAKTTYDIDGAIMFTPPWASHEWNSKNGRMRYTFEITPTFEAHVSTLPKTAKNALTYMMPISLSMVNNSGKPDKWGVTQSIFSGANPAEGPLLAGHRFDLIPTYRTDRHSDTKAMELLLAWRPVAPRLGLGVDIPIVGEKVRFRWSPVIGVEMADYTDVVDKPGAAAKVPIEGSYSRAYAEVTAELFFGQTLKLFGNYKIRQELNRTNNTYQWIEAGATLDLDADGHLSLNATYQRGEDAPTFEDVDKFILGFGVKF